MIIIQDPAALQKQLNKARNNGLHIGFVPTMGALHDGHLSLVERARNENQLVVCSIFVNPTQFNDPKDLANYPRTLAADLALLEGAACDIVFVPRVSDIYPKGEDPISFSFGELESRWEGAMRPGHFRGVGIVVNKLLEITLPNRLYLGQKDLQQCRIIAQLLKQIELSPRPELIICPTQREEDGLAMSSRNQRLSAEARAIAPCIYAFMEECKVLRASYSPSELSKQMFERLAKHPSVEPEYFAFVEGEALEEVTDWNQHRPVMVVVAAKVGGIRLIDNAVLIP